ncbi:AraC family transcriptional regulator [Ohessyouella blattaphilus]|uniref:AraC family transcriptional regulator n=1 Tax=Ohessyouella blattaphilus TaxID=2949333 RepID=A0ABT1EGA6_9FIRM|nr:AraC family transcriptional regulator [Ohessyouella blattaphilus]MCP1109740.1 AraC family transcriptional regulator [Ohessyouella blattaphilus]MCR8563134.1 AraC family transcriptional regulator [Ohessyouella blattaphilus]
MIENTAISHAIDYILAHINEPIHVSEIAAHCNFSKHHLSRLFKAETGEGIYEFIKRLKIEQSAFRLKIEQARNITDISGDYGYSSSNYSTAFKQHYDVSPVEFRRTILQKSRINPIFNNASAGWESFEECKRKITIDFLPDYYVVYDRHKGSYRSLSEHWCAFLEKHKAYRTDETLLIERTYDDPNITNTDNCLYDLYMTVPEDSPLERTCYLNGGKFAIYHFEGFVNQIYHALQSIFTVWLPQSGYIIDERYSFDIYRKIDGMYMEIDFCIPIK